MQHVHISKEIELQFKELLTHPCESVEYPISPNLLHSNSGLVRPKNQAANDYKNKPKTHIAGTTKENKLKNATHTVSVYGHMEEPNWPAIYFF